MCHLRGLRDYIDSSSLLPIKLRMHILPGTPIDSIFGQLSLTQLAGAGQHDSVLESSNKLGDFWSSICAHTARPEMSPADIEVSLPPPYAFRKERARQGVLKPPELHPNLMRFARFNYPLYLLRRSILDVGILHVGHSLWGFLYGRRMLHQVLGMKLRFKNTEPPKAMSDGTGARVCTDCIIRRRL
jgi:hypothetical protein